MILGRGGGFAANYNNLPPSLSLSVLIAARPSSSLVTALGLLLLNLLLLLRVLSSPSAGTYPAAAAAKS